MNERLTITLPEQTVRLLKRVAGRRPRSRLIDRAVRCYLTEEMCLLRRQLADSYRANAAAFHPSFNSVLVSVVAASL